LGGAAAEIENSQREAPVVAHMTRGIENGQRPRAKGASREAMLVRRENKFIPPEHTARKDAKLAGTPKTGDGIVKGAATTNHHIYVIGNTPYTFSQIAHDIIALAVARPGKNVK